MTRRSFHRQLPIWALAGLCGGALAEDGAPDLKTALTGGTVSFASRYRLERVDQDGFDDEALASTVRAALGYRTGTWRGCSAMLEFETTQYVGEQRFDNPADREPDHPVVADPEHVEVNQAWLAWEGLSDTRVQLGRQRIVFDDARFVGNVGWRQNEQTFDALRVDHGSVEHLALTGVVTGNVNRIFSDRAPEADTALAVTGDDRFEMGLLLHAAYEFPDIGTLAAFDYLTDYTYKDGLDRNTLGARFSGKRQLGEPWSLHYAASLAVQTDIGDNPDEDLSEAYGLLEAGVGWKSLVALVGYEVLSGDGGNAFQTPLATGHAFNGWADKFLATPADGLEDLYLGIEGAIPAVDGLAVAGSFHVFTGNESGDAFGTELDLQATWALKRIDPKLVVGAKLALYRGDDDAPASLASDVDKFWLWVQWAF